MKNTDRITPSLPLIEYGPIEMPGGVTGRPDSRSVMLKAIAGHPVAVPSSFAYINLYHVFDRLVAKDKKLENLKLVRQQVGPSRWILNVVPKDDTAKPLPLDKGYEPVRGRNKRLAARLAEGKPIRIPKNHVSRVLAAWRKIVPAAKRQGVRARTIPVSDTNVVVTIPA